MWLDPQPILQTGELPQQKPNQNKGEGQHCRRTDNLEWEAMNLKNAAQELSALTYLDYKDRSHPSVSYVSICRHLIKFKNNLIGGKNQLVRVADVR